MEGEEKAVHSSWQVQSDSIYSNAMVTYRCLIKTNDLSLHAKQYKMKVTGRALPDEALAADVN